MIKKWILGCLCALVLILPARASERDTAASEEVEGVATSVPHNAETWRIGRAAGAIVVDGRIDDAEWADTLTVPLRYETDPGENVAPPVETHVLLAFDNSTVYVAFRADDPSPDKIRAHLMDRDSAWDNDFVGILFDPFNDERRGFEFFANPLGVQMDLFFDGVSGREDSSWDAIWDSAGRITETGFEVEFAIPFSSLRFPSTEDIQTWGIDALRFYPREQRHRIALQPMDRDLNCYLCQVSKMEGIEGIDPGRNLEVVPTLTSSQVDTRDEDTNALQSGASDTDLGLTAKWGITPSLILNAAINPDFSNVEADVAQLNINEQFALFFPEKRPFFLEGADFFRTQFDTVFSRNVANPDWGIKLSGKIGDSALAVFAATDKVTNLLLPRSQGSSATSLDLESEDVAFRYRHDVADNSSIGVVATSRTAEGYHNNIAGIDGRFKFKDSHSVDVQWLSSDTEYPLDVVQEFGTPSGSFSDRAYTVGYNYDSRSWEGYFRYNDVGNGFRADLGFEPRVDFTFLLGGLQRSWWPEDKKISRAWFGGDWDITHDQSGQLLERETEVNGGISLPKQSFVEFGGGVRDRFFDGVTFDQAFYWNFLQTRPNGNLTLRMFSRLDTDAIDFAHTRPGDQLRFNPEIDYKFGKHLRASVDYDWRQFDVQDGTLFAAALTQSKWIYQFNRRSFLRLITQYTQIDRSVELYQDEVDTDTERLFNQLLFSYKVNPQTVLFVGYSETQAATNGSSLEKEDRSLFLKLGYAWVS